jgi:hypothetical protein
MTIIHEEGVILLLYNDFDRQPGQGEKRHRDVKAPNWLMTWRFREARLSQHAAQILI